MSLPYFEVDTRNERLKTLSGKHGSLWSEFNQRLDYSWIFHDHGLEGVVLQYSEIAAAFSEKLSQDGQSISLHQEIRNLRDTIEILREFVTGKRQKERYSKTMLSTLYEKVVVKLRGVPDGDGLRREDGRYGAYYHKCCPHPEIEARLKKFFQDLNQTSIDEVHPLVSAARLHYDLMRIMPYGRFSGRVVRLFMNLWLMRHNYPPAIVHTVERARYYEALAWEDEGHLLNLLRDSINNTVESALLFIEEGILERRRKREARKARKIEIEQQKLALEEKKLGEKKTKEKASKPAKTTKAAKAEKEVAEKPATKSTKKTSTKAAKAEKEVAEKPATKSPAKTSNKKAEKVATPKSSTKASKSTSKSKTPAKSTKKATASKTSSKKAETKTVEAKSETKTTASKTSSKKAAPKKKTTTSKTATSKTTSSKKKTTTTQTKKAKSSASSTTTKKATKTSKSTKSSSSTSKSSKPTKSTKTASKNKSARKESTQKVTRKAKRTAKK